MKLSDLENLFIEKLTDKFKLTERDIGRAFKKYDLDSSGHLDLDELTKAIHMFVPGCNYALGKRNGWSYS